MTTHVTELPVSFAPPASPTHEGGTDEALLTRVVAGDKAAAQLLVLRYHEPLMRYLRRLGGQAAAADELHQQTWLSVLQHAARFDAKAGGGFKAWLFRIATNKANDLWRKKKRERFDDERIRQTAAEATPDRAMAAEEAARLAAAIDKLPEAQRQVLLLRYYSGLKFTEIAETLGCPLNTALGRMHKAVGRLKVLLEETEAKRP